MNSCYLSNLRHTHRAIGQRKEDGLFLFSQVEPSQNGVAHLLRSECAKVESEGDYRFKVVKLHAALVRQVYGTLYLVLSQHATLAKSLYPSPNGRGGNIEQIQQLGFVHPYIGYVIRQNNIAELIYCDGTSFHSPMPLLCFQKTGSVCHRTS